MRVRANPKEVALVHCSGCLCTTQPHEYSETKPAKYKLYDRPSGPRSLGSAYGGGDIRVRGSELRT
jgi:hypothetical protein